MLATKNWLSVCIHVRRRTPRLLDTVSVVLNGYLRESARKPSVAAIQLPLASRADCSPLFRRSSQAQIPWLAELPTTSASRTLRATISISWGILADILDVCSVSGCFWRSPPSPKFEFRGIPLRERVNTLTQPIPHNPNGFCRRQNQTHERKTRRKTGET